MATLTFDPSATPRPHTHHGVGSSPPAPLNIGGLSRPASQRGLHMPALATHYPPASAGLPISATPQTTPAYRYFQSGAGDVSLPSAQIVPSPAMPESSSAPATGLPGPFFPNAAGLFDRQPQSSTPVPGVAKPLQHLPPVNTASNETDSTRYSSLSVSPPYEEIGRGMTGPPSATAAYTSAPIKPAASAYGGEATEVRHTHVNPSVLNYGMSRSTSDGSDRSIDVHGRLVTPHLELPPWSAGGDDQVAIRRSSGGSGYGGYASGLGGKYYQASNYGLDYSAPQHFSYGAHPQPQGAQVFNGGYVSTAERGVINGGYVSTAERGGIKEETEYEQERLAQIDENRKLMGSLGLGVSSSPFARSNSRDISMSSSRQPSMTGKKRQFSYDSPVRQSSRIASMGRQSYAELDEGVEVDEEYTSDDAAQDEAMWQQGGTKRARHFIHTERMYGRKPSAPGRRMGAPELTLHGLLQVYPNIPHCYPLFYYTLNNDLTINSDSVGLIGSIPSSFSPLEKADALKSFFHRGRRVIAQIDAFTARCDRKNEDGPDKWEELEFYTRIAIRDVRRKVVERCENYKYTRRDLLDKVVGKNAWQPIEHGMIEWKAGMTNNDPAGDLANVHLTLPTPPLDALAGRAGQAFQGDRYHAQPNFRPVRPMPSRARLVTNPGARLISVNMDAPASSVMYDSPAGPQSGMMHSAYTPWSSYGQRAHTPLPTYEQHQQHHAAQLSATSASMPSVKSMGSMSNTMSVNTSQAADGPSSGAAMQPLGSSMSFTSSAMLTSAPPTRMWTTTAMPLRSFEIPRSRSVEANDESGGSSADQPQPTGSSV